MLLDTMNLRYLLAVLSVLLLSNCLISVYALELGAQLKQDAEALTAFRTEIKHDPSGALRDWNALENPCRWYGVECAQVLTEEHQLEDRVVSLELWGLELEGSISPQIGRLTELRKLALVGNKLTGEVPTDIGNCRGLSTLDLRANKLSGPIRFSLADLPRLKVLKLSENRLTGTLRDLFVGRKSFETFNPFHFLEDRSSSEGVVMRLCPSLEVLDVAQNSLSGKLPSAIGACEQLVEVSFNDNQFVGSIPAAFSSLPHLRSLFLNKNRIDGILPSAIATGCKKLQFLNVADNLLVGNIPAEFANFGGSRNFDFSNNRLEGPVPRGKWKVQQMVLAGVFSGNLGLCGWPLAQVCFEKPHKIADEEIFIHSPGSLVVESLKVMQGLYSRIQGIGRGLVSVHQIGKSHLSRVLGIRRSMAEAAQSPASAPAPSGPATSSKKSKHTVRKWALGLALGMVAGAVAAAILATLLRVCIFYMHKTPNLQGPIIFNPHITPKMLLFLEKDESLSGAELVGEGGAGRVYKAQLENGMEVAVKRVPVTADQKGLFGQRQIQAELETLGCIRHRNLVTLLAYVHRPDCHLLLYEYMPNGSLYNALAKIHAGDLELPWPTRHNIVVGIANGLNYLHFNCNPKIVHRDLKPSNILLDSNYTAHVSDFGLAKVIPGEDTHATTGVAGTVGYIAPEYSQTCRLTEKSDIYSFGVVVAVLLTGKDPTDAFFHMVPGGSIGGWLQDLLQKGEGKDAIDPKLRDTEYEEEILLAMKLAVFCTNANPSERPSSKDLLIMLNQIRKEEP